MTNIETSDVITFETNDTSADASDLNDLKALVDTFTSPNLVTITENAGTANLSTEITNALVLVPNADITINGSITSSLVNTIVNVTSGVVTATVDSATASTLNSVLLMLIQMMP